MGVSKIYDVEKEKYAKAAIETYVEIKKHTLKMWELRLLNGRMDAYPFFAKGSWNVDHTLLELAVGWLKKIIPEKDINELALMVQKRKENGIKF